MGSGACFPGAARTDSEVFGASDSFCLRANNLVWQVIIFSSSSSFNFLILINDEPFCAVDRLATRHSEQLGTSWPWTSTTLSLEQGK